MSKVIPSVLESHHPHPHSKIPNPKHQITNKSQIPISKHKGLFGILKLGIRPQGGESKRSADNFGRCDLFGICYLLFGNSGYSVTPVFLATLDYLDATDHGQLTTDTSPSPVYIRQNIVDRANNGDQICNGFALGHHWHYLHIGKSRRPYSCAV